MPATNNRFFLTFCGLLLTISAFSVDIVLPAFELMSTDFKTPVSRVQMTVPLYFIGFGIGQLVFGPFSDAWGRKLSINSALAIYLAGSIVALLSPGIVGVLIGRVLQGVGGGAVQVVARAMIRDRFSGDDLVRNMSFAMTIFAFGPIVAPLLGALVVTNEQWYPIFLAMLVFGIVLIVMGTQQSETHKNPNPAAIAPHNLWKAACAVIANRQSRWFVVISGLATVAILSMVTNVPVIMKNEFGTDRNVFAACFAIAGIGIIFGQKLNRLMLTRIGPVRAAMVGAFGCAIAFVVILILALTELLQPWSLVAMLFTFNLFYLTMFANSISLAIDPHGSIAGVASSVTGFLGSLIGAVVSGTWTLIADGRVEVWATLIIVQSLLCATLLFIWRRIRPV